MIEQVTIDNRPALAAYINAAFEPTSAADATMVKVTFTDDQGGVMFLVPAEDTAKAGQDRARLKWDESQHPRIPSGSGGGEFTEGGGGGGGESEDKPPRDGKPGKGASDLFHSEQKVDVNAIIDKHPGAREAIAQAREKLKSVVPTGAPLSQGGHMLPGGAYAPARRELHKQIVKKLFTPEAVAAATPKAGDAPRLDILGGRGGSGKSWFTKSGVVDGKSAIYINGDDFKEALPEYQGWNAAQLHEESSYLGNLAERYARVRNLNIIHDATMRSSGSNARLTKRLEEWYFLQKDFKTNGYKVNGYYMHASPQTAADRAVGRFMNSGRFVPPEYIASSTTNEAVFDSLRGKFDDWKVYDNNASDFTPKLYAQKQDQHEQRQADRQEQGERQARRPEEPQVRGGELPQQTGADPGGALRQRSTPDERRRDEAQVRRDDGRTGAGDFRQQGQAEGTIIDTREWDEEKHPRVPEGEHGGGQFTSGGGGGASESESGGKDKDKDKGSHPGPGYSASARVKGGVIYTPNVYDAQRALFENRRVELDQPKKISMLIKRLGETAAKMAQDGKAAPNFNLCNVTVSGTNLFCADTKGIPRIKMPQMDQIQTKLFRKHLKEEGYKVKKDTERSANLRATQNELIGTKVAARVAKMKAKGQDTITARLIVSKDDYVLDGHHRWAAQLALDSEAGKLNNGHKIKIARVNIGITKLLELANKFTGGKNAQAGTI